MEITNIEAVLTEVRDIEKAEHGEGDWQGNYLENHILRYKKLLKLLLPN